MRGTVQTKRFSFNSRLPKSQGFYTRLGHHFLQHRIGRFTLGRRPARMGKAMRSDRCQSANERERDRDRDREREREREREVVNGGHAREIRNANFRRQVSRHLHAHAKASHLKVEFSHRSSPIPKDQLISSEFVFAILRICPVRTCKVVRVSKLAYT